MTPSPSSPAASTRRKRVHDAVRELLSEQGFRMSMEAVAQRAGCSKQTLYAQFGSRQELLRSVVQDHLEGTTTCLDQPGTSLQATLVGFSVEFLQGRADPSVAGTSRLLRAEATQFPEEASALYRHGFDVLQQRLAQWLQGAMARGQLREDEPARAAELLLGMVIGLDFERQHFAVAFRDDANKQRSWAEFAVDAFLRLYAPVGGATTATPLTASKP